MANNDAAPTRVQHVTSICSNFYSMFQVPIAWWQDGQRVAGSGFAEGVEPDRHALPRLLERLGDTDETTVGFSGAGGCVFVLARPQGTGSGIVMGPVFPLGTDDASLVAFMDALGTPPELTDSVLYSVGLVPTITHERLRSLAELVALLLETPAQVEEDPQDWQWGQASEVHERAIATFGTVPSAELHHLVETAASLVREGDTDGVNRLMDEWSKAFRASIDTRKATSLEVTRMARSIFDIVLAEAVEHGALPGGLDAQQAYSLLDSYAWQCGGLASVAEMVRLMRAALVELADLVADRKGEANVSAEVRSCMHEISTSLDSCPTIDELAVLIGRSRSYTTRRFRQEVGMSVGEYATLCRIREAKHMLRYTSLPLSTISERLGYASQSYFCNVFKRETGTTPRKYRTAAVGWADEGEV